VLIVRSSRDRRRMVFRRIWLLGLSGCFILSGCDDGSSAEHCWQLLRTRHAQLYVAIDPDYPRVAEINDAREKLRTALKHCAPRTSLAAPLSAEHQAVSSVVTLLDLSILADDVPLTETLFLRLDADAGSMIATGELTYGGLYLQAAAFAESARVVDWLLAQGADPNEPDDHGVTPLHAAAARTEGGLYAIRSLVEYGADIERRSESGFTPLLSGRERGDLRKVQCLVALGARVPTEGVLVDQPRPMSNPAAVKSIDDFLASGERSIPEEIGSICSR